MPVPAENTLTVRPVAGHIGADISGVDLSRPLSAEEARQIRAALLRWKVVFFRGQNVDHAAQIAFARHFGELTYAHPHDDTPPEGFPEIFTIDPKRYEQRYKDGFARQRTRRKYSYFGGWHTDVTPAVNPPAASILRAETVPEYGGDTTWTNTVAAYEGLSAPVRAFIDGLRAEHRYGADEPPVGDSGYARRVNDNLLVAHHPVVRVHPETGERALFVSPGFVSHILDVTPRESRALLQLLYEQLTRPEYTVRFRWEPGSVAFWDNRATAHLAPNDLDHLDVARRLHRVTLIGDVPVGPDGRESELISGKPFAADHRVAVST
ncbi:MULTISPECIES: TauD/TfdA dioxygenase family protein [Streptomyces violaceusniger group]|uniref:TauD/TfdA family dioxygenase n=2 Tax=Streptomyces rhizosphaericus TaxID=114699 RepID=A0ABN1PI88_9ACTN|nr:MULTISPECIES: TauD/TfdA family dioxygenase [Streptomyces violaceusniger group]